MIEGDAERAARLLGAAEHSSPEVEAAADPDELERQQSVREWAAQELGADAVHALRASGAETRLDELVPVTR